MINFFFGTFFKLFGWKIQGGIPEGLKKYVIAVAPHTSNWDFAVGMGARAIIKFRPNFLAKDSLFKFKPLAWFFKSIGGVPVDRSKKTNMVDQVVEQFEKYDEFVMTVAPEGTRSYSPEWKTGFYRMAHKANVPIVKIAFDYPSKTVVVAEPFIPSGDVEKEMAEMKEYFKQFTGRNPEQGVK